MKVILIHGLGQEPSSWEAVKEKLSVKDTSEINLVVVQDKGPIGYKDLYDEVKRICGNSGDKFSLVGISLGGTLALNYAVDFPEAVDSLTLINTQFKMPKVLLSLQNIFFKFIPKSKFESTGFTKENFIKICSSMKQLDFSERLKEVTCKTLVINGENDKINRKASKQLSELIPNAKLVILENSGHEANLDTPSGLAAEINKFLN